MNENKKGVRAKKHKVASIEPSKPRNFVAKNAIQGGAGAHKDKKKAMKQGDVKHKKSYAEHLDAMLNDALTESRQINETGLDPIRRMKAIQFIANKTGWEKNYLELASDEELMDLFVKIKKGEPVGEGDGISKEKETEFHAKLDKLVHNTFGKRKEESVGTDQASEGAEFGAYYSEQVAQQIFNKRQDITSEDEVLNQAYHIVANEQGQKTARYKFNYDEDFPSDVVSSYFWLQRNKGVAEAMTPQQQHDFDRMRAGAMSRQAYDAKWKKPRKSDDEVIYGKRKGVAEGWTHDTLAARLFEQELTYEDKLNNMLAKKLQK